MNWTNSTVRVRVRIRVWISQSVPMKWTKSNVPECERSNRNIGHNGLEMWDMIGWHWSVGSQIYWEGQ